MSPPQSSFAYINEVPVWFAMSATFGRSEKAEGILLEKSVECYVPKKWTVTESSRRKKERELVPVISNLIFVHTSWQKLMELKGLMPWLQIITFPQRGHNVPIIVPDKQMEDFMQVTSDENNRVKYLSPEEAGAAKGKKVRIIGGQFNNVEGILLSSRGRGKKKLVVSIEGLIAVSAEVESYDFISVVD